jgi:hypothetical protein
MDRAAFALPAIGEILVLFLLGTKLPSRKARLQSSLAWESGVVSNFSRICSHFPGLATLGVAGGKWTGCHIPWAGL